MPRVKTTHKVHPSERFPTKPRPDGRFQKRIRGTLYYFGQNGDRATALAEYERVKSALYDGRTPRPAIDDDTLTLKELANRYITERELEVTAGRLSDNWHHQCKKAIDRFGKKIGGSRTIGSLTPDDFASYARHLSTALGEHAYNRERESIVTMFRHAYDSDWIERPVKLGKKFARISAAKIREARTNRLASGPQIAILLATLALDDTQLEAMLLLAINAGFGPTDCSILRWQNVNLEDAMIPHLRRPKTNIDRDAPLWPETVEALQAIRDARPHDDLVFRTKYGNAWTDHAIAHQLAKRLDALNAQRHNAEPLTLVIGDLRHTFATYANENGDNDAYRRIMGHVLPGLKATYVETIFTPRLRKVVHHVRDRIFTNRENDPS